MLFWMSAAFLLVVGAQHASSQETVVIDNLTYSVSDGCATLVSGKASAEAPDVVIPERIPVGDSMVDVTRIGARAFHSYRESTITSVDIPKTVVEIGSGAFCGCQNLKTVIFRGCPVLDIGAFWYDIDYNRVLLDRVVCYSSVPPKCGSDCFSCFETYSPSYQKREVELQVPKGCAEAYANSIAWYRFDVTEMEAEPFVPESYDVEETGLVYRNGICYELRKSPDVSEARVMPLHVPFSAEGIDYEYYIHQAELDIPDEVRLNDRLVFKVTEIADDAFYCWMEYDWNFFKIVNIPGSVRRIGNGAFSGCRYLTTVNLSEGIKEIGNSAFSRCSIKELSLPASVEQIGDYVFSGCSSLTTVYCYAVTPPSCTENSFNPEIREAVVFYVPEGCCEAYEASPGWNSVTIREIGDDTGISSPEYGPYRPFVEDDKVWKVGDITTGNPVQLVEYYYFDGDTIIDGKTCKQMMCLEYLGPNYRDYLPQDPWRYVGAWYEEDKKVYEYDTTDKQFKLMYDFSVDANANLPINGRSYVIGPRQTGGIKGFKGVYRDVWGYGDGERMYKFAPWLEGVGGIYGSPKNNVFNVELADPRCYLMSCTVGDEVIYLNDGYEDGATPAEARKHRFDFTHTTKIQPKSRNRSGAETEESLYGEYNDHQLCINLDPLDDTYLVRITDEPGKAVYEKNINAGNIVGLNIDISAYPEGRYTVTVENSQETFTGEFEAQTTGIEVVRNKKEVVGDYIYNLQGQRLSTLQKGLNIVNGQKVYVK